jgi:aryl-alcohol dehydrogenase-like predicted oxidoreductase
MISSYDPKRRQLIKLSIAAAMASSLSLSETTWAVDSTSLIRKAIPSSGEMLPVIGLGTNNYSPTTAEERATRRTVVAELSAAGASVIDTAPAYRDSEATLGELMTDIGNRSKIFLATKVTAASGERSEGEAMLKASREKLRSETLDLVQVHNLIGTAALLPLLREEKTAGRVRYLGVTTSRDTQYAELIDLMRRESLDFIQVDYSIANRSAAEVILPLALERGMAVLVNLPLGGRRGSLFAKVKDRDLPDFAAELGIASWGQFFLKYIVSHPAVTCAIPGMTRLANLEDNLGAARGVLPDAEQRARMALWWDNNVGDA